MATATRYGKRWACPEHGCTVVCWDGHTSTPANYETRQARHAAHEVFDPLWKSGNYDRRTLYARLSEYMGTKADKTHIGMFSVEQCAAVIRFCETIEAPR